MSDKLTVNAVFMGKEPRHEPKECIVEKSIPVSHSEFEEINSNLIERNYYIEQFKELMCCSDDKYHCILIYDKDGGDGLLVESEGFNYARYSQYIPHTKDIIEAHEQTTAMSELKNHIGRCVDEWLDSDASQKDMCISEAELFNDDSIKCILSRCVSEAVQNRPDIVSCTIGNGYIEAERKELTATKLYCPLQIIVDDHDEDADLYELPSACYIDHKNKINEKIKKSFDYDERERGLVTWCDDKNITQRIYSAIPYVEVRNGDLFGVVELKSYGKIDPADLISVSDYIKGQLSDGWGESFEQHEIKAGDEDLYISFWNSGNEYFLKPESEIFPDQNYELTLGG